MNKFFRKHKAIILFGLMLTGFITVVSLIQNSKTTVVSVGGIKIVAIKSVAKSVVLRGSRDGRVGIVLHELDREKQMPITISLKNTPAEVAIFDESGQMVEIIQVPFPKKQKSIYARSKYLYVIEAPLGYFRDSGVSGQPLKFK